jgi:hypothetical protein
MDHHLGVGASGKFDGFDDNTTGKEDKQVYVPRFRNLVVIVIEVTTNVVLFTKGSASREGWEEAW